MLDQYLDRHDREIVESIAKKLSERSTPSIDPDLVQGELNFRFDINDITAFLEDLVQDNVLDATDLEHCVSESCQTVVPRNILSSEEIEAKRCNVCEQSFGEVGLPLGVRFYLTKHKRSRDIHWMIVVHGFNTKGPWQEKLSWLLSSKLRYAAPILIYKYGFERLGIFFRWRHNLLVRRLGAEITAAVNEARELGRSSPPDIIVHSFGSLLFSKVLSSASFKHLKFGRVICVGSVISPQFKWEDYIESGRVEAVLCHSGGKDLPVRLAQYAIPDAGAAGYVGFNSGSVTNIHSPDFEHSTALEQNNLSNLLEDGGVWDRFYTEPEGLFDDSLEIPSPNWKPWPRLVRGLARYLVLSFGLALLMALVVLSSVGISSLL